MQQRRKKSQKGYVTTLASSIKLPVTGSPRTDGKPYWVSQDGKGERGESLVKGRSNYPSAPILLGQRITLGGLNNPTLLCPTSVGANLDSSASCSKASIEKSGTETGDT